MKKTFALAMTLVLASFAFAAFDESHFNYGRQWDNDIKGVNLSGKGLTHLAMYIGDGSREIYNTYWEGEMVRAAKAYNLTPVFYAYVIAEWDKHLGNKDCDVGTPNHCTKGAETIRNEWNTILSRYTAMAQGVAQDYGTSGTTIWLIEPDFFQYSVSGDNHDTRFSQEGGGIPDAELCGTRFNQIVAAIKSVLPNAKIGVDISPWLNDGIITWYANFDQSKVDYLFTSGGRTQGDQSRIRNDNNNLLTWAGASAAMGGKKIIADDGYGVGGGAEENYDDWMNVNNLNARIADGVIGITIKAPRDAFYTFAASNPISINGGNSSNSTNSSSSAAQSSSSRPSSSSVTPTPSNLTALIDNFEDGDEFSEWGGEWTTYTDAGDGGQSTITTSYSTGYSSSKALKASYTLRKGSLNYDPQVGISVDLLADKSAVNLNSCTSISYYYKGAAHAVRMESPLVTDYAYHQTNVEAANSWTKKTVTLTSMTQPDWTSTNVNVSSARQSVKAFSWQVSGANNTSGSLEIDNVRCEGLPEAASSSSAKSSSSVLSSSSARSSSSVSSSSVSSSSISSSSVSSSSLVSSSNSTGGSCIAFVNGTGDYGDHCYNSGLNDMEEGKCYTMNPERNPAPQWINGSVTETYWWVETSCGEEESSSSSEEVSSSSAIPSFTITFKNGNAVLQTVEVEQGAIPEYTGAEPTKAATAQYMYSFAGWTPELAAVTENKTYQAKFDSVVNYYSIRFLNGTQLLATESVAYGSLPVYSGETPTKAADAGYTYAFDGWTPDLAPVTQATDYTAKFKGTKRKYSVTFLDDDGVTVLKEAAMYDFGTLASEIVLPTNVTKPANVEYTYEFSGWSPELMDVVDNVTYMAVYTATKKKYPVTFVDEDGTTVLLAAVEYPHGTRPVNIAKPADPTKDASAEYTYTFAGWTPALAMVTGEATYTATYTATKRKYTVTFENGDGTSSSSQVEYGTVPTAPAGKTPANTAQYTYSFDGWNPTVVAVTGDAIYAAVVDSVVNKYSVTFKDEDGAVLYTATYPYGTAAADIIKPRTPEKPATAEYTYEFSGWSPKIADVTDDAIYTATYKSIKRKYTITYLNEDGSVFTKAEYEYGTPAKSLYLAENPTKKATAQYTYTFAGWTPALTKVTGEASYTATFNATVNKYSVTFKDEDGAVLLAAAEYDYGTLPADIVKPADPIKQGTAGETFTFAGWSPAIVMVTEDIVYRATYTSSTNSYTVTFINEDGTSLSTATYPYGTAAADIVKPRTPEKPATAEYTYEFSGWSPKVADVTDDATYTATYKSFKRQYTITYLNEDESVFTKAEYEYGTPAKSLYLAENPTKKATAQYTYTFAGWTPALANVTGEATYKATYTATTRKYTITFVNGDGSTTTQDVEYGTKPTAPAGKTPANTAEFTYSFSGWNPTIVNVTGEATYTAEVTSTVNEYQIVFLNYNGTELQSSMVAYGTTPQYIGTPTRDSDNQYTYKFTGWTPSVVPVTEEASYTATFSATAIPVESSSSVEVSSSSEIVVTSSSEEVSSSSEIVVTSSSEEVSSSSEDVVESSSSEESSSSDDDSSSSAEESPCIAFVNGQGGYGEHCYNSGMDDMEDGKCYTLNPERAPDIKWAGGSATDTYWWMEASCQEFVPPSSSSQGPETFVAGKSSMLNMSFRNNMLTVAVPKQSLVRVQVFDLLGNRVKAFQDSFAGSRDISLQGLPQGSYMVRVMSGSTAKTSRINIR